MSEDIFLFLFLLSIAIIAMFVGFIAAKVTKEKYLSGSMLFICVLLMIFFRDEYFITLSISFYIVLKMFGVHKEKVL